MLTTTAQSLTLDDADRTAMTTNSVPCRIQMLPKIHRIPRKNNKKTSSSSIDWRMNPQKTSKTTSTTSAQTPAKKAAPPTSRMASPPSTVDSSPGASAAAKSTSPAAAAASSMGVKKEEVKMPKKQCAIALVPKVHKRVRTAAAPICNLADLPLQEICFVHSDPGGDVTSEIAKTLLFGEDEGFEGILLMNDSSINCGELDDDDDCLQQQQQQQQQQ